MSRDKTKIEWTDVTFNYITGCTPASAGCANCYARVMANRLKGRYGYPETDPFKPGTVHENMAGRLNGWKDPSFVFVSSMGDLFHDDVKFNDIDALFWQMAQAPHHTYQILTKRPENMLRYFEGKSQEGSRKMFNLWLGVSTEDQASADDRIPKLLELRPWASKLWISAEPMLGPIDFKCRQCDGRGWYEEMNWSTHTTYQEQCGFCQGTLVDGSFHNLDWVVCGAENGQKKRPFKEEWAISLRDQCQAAGVPFWFKNDDLEGIPEKRRPE